jgi:hypothetical protein
VRDERSCKRPGLRRCQDTGISGVKIDCCLFLTVRQRELCDECEYCNVFASFSLKSVTNLSHLSDFNQPLMFAVVAVGYFSARIFNSTV